MKTYYFLFISFLLIISACQKDPTTSTDHCTNGVMDGDETGVDCGGSCDTCVIVLPPVDPFPVDSLYTFNDDIEGVKFFNHSIGLVHTSTSLTKSLYKTTDGGTTWTYLITPTNNTLRDIDFGTTSNIILICDYLGNSYRSTDEGSSWSLIGNNFTNIELLTDSFFIAEHYSNTPFYTADAGQTFTQITLNGGAPSGLDPQGDYSFINDTTGFMFMRDGSGNIYNYKTIDKGITWDLVTQVLQQPIQGVHFLDENNGFVETDYDFIKTTDGGLSWSIVDSEQGYIHFYNGKGIVVGQYCHYSLDNGVTWNTIQDNSGTSPEHITFGYNNHAIEDLVYGHRNKTLVTYDMNNLN